MTRRRSSSIALLVLGILVIAGPARSGRLGKSSRRSLDPASISFEQRLDAVVPPDAEFVGTSGTPVRMEDFMRGRPILLVLGYFRCPMLCGLVEKGLLESLNALRLDIGVDYDVISLSIDPRETPEEARDKKRRALSLYKRAREAGSPQRRAAREGWAFLTGEESQVRRVADAVGFGYRYDEATDEWAHPAGVVLLTPEGRVSRYFFGIAYLPRDLRLGIVEATEGKVGDVVDALLLLCYGYDPATGKYSLAIMKVLRVAGLLTVVFMVLMVGFFLRRDSSSDPPRHAGPLRGGHDV